MKISAGTIARTIVLIIALVNQVLTSMGKNPLPFAEETLYEAISYIVTIAASLIAWWKNNSITPEAIAADQYMHSLKSSGSISEDVQE